MVIPGGVLGDVDRAVRHGSAVGDVGRGLRSVAWERLAGLFVYLVLGLVVLVLLPSRLPTWLPVVVAGVIVGAVAGALLLSGRPPRGASRAARAFRAAAADIRDGLLARRVGPGIALASVVAGRRPCGHAALGGAYRRSDTHLSCCCCRWPCSCCSRRWCRRTSAAGVLVRGWPRGPSVPPVWAPPRAWPTTTVYAVLTLAAISPGIPLLVAAWLRRRRHAGDPSPG